MCGIAGLAKFNGQEVFEQELAPMNDALSHRGPDEQGIKIVGNAGLAHRRLSIIDLESGAQPMCNEDGSIWISFNGEIYNFREIRKFLISKGHVFKTNSDTEAIIHLYEEIGEECPTKLNGMFAFAILDTRKKKIFLARDRLGQKPLFYFCDSAKFAFASELQSLLKLDDIPKDIDMQAFHDYLSLQYVPCPKTIYHSIFKLPPGHTITIDIQSGKKTLRQYWKCNYGDKKNISFDTAREELRALVEDSVRLRMISDVPLGAFLSGGLDSSIICGIMSKLSKEPIKTFTIGFDEAIYDEREAAKIVSAKFATDHRERVVDAKDFDVLQKLVRHYGEPYSDSSMLPTYLLSKFARENVKVALSGDGADEIFTGYYRYLVMKYANFADLIPLPLRKSVSNTMLSLIKKGVSERTFAGKIRRILCAVSESPSHRYFGIINRFSEEMKRAVYGSKMLGLEFSDTEVWLKSIFNTTSSPDMIEKIAETDLNSYLPNDILVKVDIASMACSLEVRNPFLDYRIAEFAASLPPEFKLHGRTRKRILREAFKDILPQETLSRQKLGFGVPLFRWFREDWANLISERLLDGKAAGEGYLDRLQMEKLISEHITCKADHSYIIWSLLIFELWIENQAAF